MHSSDDMLCAATLDRANGSSAARLCAGTMTLTNGGGTTAWKGEPISAADFPPMKAALYSGESMKLPKSCDFGRELPYHSRVERG